MPAKKKNALWDILKKLFLIIIIIQMVPAVLVMLKKSMEDVINPKDNIAVVDLHGVVWNSSRYIKQIKSFAKRSDIKGILLRINSPGGVPAPSQLIFSEILKIKSDACLSII